MTEIKHTGTCGKCQGRCHYVRIGSTAGYWVHDENGDFISTTPERHDCNTHVIRDKD